MTDGVWVAILSLMGTLIGSLAGIVTSGRLTLYRIEQLEKKVDKHNGLIERVSCLEHDQKSMAQALNKLKG